MDERVERIKEMTDPYTILIVRYEDKRPPGRPKCRWNNCKMHVK
jgi:hypothetical protein